MQSNLKAKVINYKTIPFTPSINKRSQHVSNSIVIVEMLEAYPPNLFTTSISKRFGRSKVIFNYFGNSTYLLQLPCRILRQLSSNYVPTYF